MKDVKDFDLATGVVVANNVFSHAPGRKHSKIPKRNPLLNKKHEPAFQTYLGKALSDVQKCYNDDEDEDEIEIYSSEDDSENGRYTDEWETDKNELSTVHF